MSKGAARSERFSLMMSRTEKQLLLRLCAIEHLPAAAVIRRLIVRHVEALDQTLGAVSPQAGRGPGEAAAADERAVGCSPDHPCEWRSEPLPHLPDTHPKNCPCRSRPAPPCCDSPTRSGGA